MVTKKPERVNPVSLHLGFDTEYNTSTEAGLPHQSPVSTQLYLHGFYLENEASISVLSKKAAGGLCGQSILGVRSYEWGTTFVFDAREVDAGITYAKHLSKCLTFLLKHVIRCRSDLEYDLNLWTLYSNAELANLFPTLDDLRELMKLQGDKPRRGHDNLKIVTIQKSAYVDNYRFGLPQGCRAIFRDIRHLLFKPSLEALGKQIGIPKLEHPNWDEVSASEWLAADPEAFIDYAATDAMIPCVAGVNFKQTVDAFVGELIESNIVDRGKTVEKLLDGIPITAAGISDRLVKAHWEYKGVWKAYTEFTKDLLENWLPTGAQRTKGGFNKYYLSDRPTHQSGVDIYDVKSQYATAMSILKVPILPPTPIATPASTVRVSEAVKLVEDCDVALLYLDWELPKGCDEWHRSVVAYDPAGDGCTLRKAQKQWITLWELQVLACTSPDALVKVHQCLGWSLRDEGSDYITNRDYITAVTTLRNKYKKVFKDSGGTDKAAELMSDTSKLIGNGTAGKYGQCKVGLEPDYLSETILRGGTISNTANGSTFTAAITNPFVFNLITGMARSFTAYSAWLNNASMVVTDSMVIAHDSFKNPAEYLTPYEQLNELLTTFEFDLEQSNADIIIFKERDYAVFKIADSKRDVLERSLESGVCLLDDSDFHVQKVAKRGWKAPSELSKAETSRKFFRDGFPRYQGQPLYFTKKNLLGMKEFLLGAGPLNSRTESESKIGSHNHRYMCDDALEFQRRKLVKELCRRNGYADALHCKVTDPELHDRLVSRAIPKPQQKVRVPVEIQRAIVVSHRQFRVKWSFRKLEKLTGVGKSTLQRWVKEVEKSAIFETILKDFRDGAKAESIMVSWFQPNCPTLHIGDDPKVHNGTPQTPTFTSELLNKPNALLIAR